MNKKFGKILEITTMAMLVALSIVSLNFIKFPLIPSAPFLEYDCADVPAILAGLIFGPVQGLTVLLLTCVIQAFTFSASSGVIGLIMHFCASATLVLIPSLVGKKYKSTKALVASLAVATVAMTIIMIPLNLVFTGIFLGTGVKNVVSMLIPAIIPFNFIKAAINSAASFLIFTVIPSKLKPASENNAGNTGSVEKSK